MCRDVVDISGTKDFHSDKATAWKQAQDRDAQFEPMDEDEVSQDGGNVLITVAFF